MSTAFITFLAAGCAAVVLLLNMNLRTSWPWTVKAAATAVTCVLLAAVYLAHLEMLGWPAGEPLPDRFVLIAADVRDPDKGGDDDGAIYIWARPLGAPTSEPRAYRLEYSRELHERVASAMDSTRRGIRQMGTVTGPSGSGPGERRGDGIRFEALGGRGLPPKRRS